MYVVSIGFDNEGVCVMCADYSQVLETIKRLPSGFPYKIFKEVEE